MAPSLEQSSHRLCPALGRAPWALLPQAGLGSLGSTGSFIPAGGEWADGASRLEGGHEEATVHPARRLWECPGCLYQLLCRVSPSPMGHPLPPCRPALEPCGDEGREGLCGAPAQGRVLGCPGVPGRVLPPHRLVQHSPSCEQGINPCVSYSPHSIFLGSETGKTLTQRTYPLHSQSHGVEDQDCPDLVYPSHPQQNCSCS